MEEVTDEREKTRKKEEERKIKDKEQQIKSIALTWNRTIDRLKYIHDPVSKYLVVLDRLTWLTDAISLGLQMQTSDLSDSAKEDINSVCKSMNDVIIGLM